jgi:hypothetical protein
MPTCLFSHTNTYGISVFIFHYHASRLDEKASLWKFSSASAIIEILVFVWKDLVIVDDDIKVYQIKKAYAFLLLWGFFEVYLFFSRES